MGKTTIEARIDSERKAAAQARAQEQGITLSGAVRRLLALWVEGKIDLAALDRLPHLPAMEDMEDLARTLEGLIQALEAFSQALRALQKMLNDAITKIGAFRATYDTALRERNLSGLYARLSRHRGR